MQETVENVVNLNLQDPIIVHNFQINDGSGFHPMPFMVDSGASTSSLSLKSYNAWSSHFPPQKPLKKVLGVDGRPVKPLLGTITTYIPFGSNTHKDILYIVGGEARDPLR